MAEGKTTTITRTVTQEIKEEGVVLTLTTEEAHSLSRIVARVGGEGRHRDASDSVYLALRDAGVSAVYYGDPGYDEITGGLMDRSRPSL